MQPKHESAKQYRSATIQQQSRRTFTPQPSEQALLSTLFELQTSPAPKAAHLKEKLDSRFVQL